MKTVQKSNLRIVMEEAGLRNFQWCPRFRGNGTPEKFIERLCDACLTRGASGKFGCIKGEGFPRNA